MKYYIKNREVADITVLLEEIKHFDKNDHSLLETLLQIFESSDNYAILDTIALKFAEWNDARVVPALIRKISLLKYTNHISTLLYACSAYDCAAYLNFFIDIAIDCGYHPMIEVIGVIEEIGAPVSLSAKIISLKKLSDYLVTLAVDAEKYNGVEHLINLVEDMNAVEK